QLEQGRAHARMAGHGAGCLARAAIGQAGVVAQAGQIQRQRGLGRRLGVAEITARIQHRQAHGAIQQAGVQIRQAVVGGQTRGDGALARGGGAVDGDDKVHAASPWAIVPPSPFIISTKPGKLVAIISGSRTETGCSAARPSTRWLMAMRWSWAVSTVAPPFTGPTPTVPVTMKPSGSSCT